MFAQLRKYAKTAFMVILFGLLIIAFVAWGNMSDTFKPMANSAVVVAGSHEISPQEFKSMVERQMPEMEQRAQRRLTLEDLAKADVDQQILQQLSVQEAFSALIGKIGIKPGAQLVADQLRSIPEFFNPISGKFEPKTYIATLQQQGIDPKTFERGLADDLAARHFAAGINSGVKAPNVYAAFQAAFAKESRSISFFAVGPSSVAPSPKPTDAQLTALMKEFADRIQIPEQRQLTIVRFSAKQLAQSMPVDQAQVEKLYNFRKDEQATAETRTVVQVSAKDAAGAQTAATRLAKGEDPGAVAKAVGGQVIAYDNKPKTAIPDRKVADTAFSLPAGQTSGAIKGDLGFAVVKVINVTPGKTVDLASMRPQLENEVRQNAAEKKISESADAFQTAIDGGASLTDAAAKAGGQVFTTPPIVQQGVDLDRKPAPGVSEKLLTSAFKMAQGSTSDIESDSRGEYYVVRVDKVIPPSLPPLEKMRPDVERAWANRDLAEKLKAKSDEVAARLRKGEAIETVAASVGATVEKAGPIDRTNANTFPRLGDLLGQTLQAKKGEIITGPARAADPKTPPKPEMLVARVDQAGVAAAGDLAQIAAQARPQFTRLLTNDLQEQMAVGARDVIKPKIYPERARAALGVDVPLPAAEKGKKTEGKKG